MNPFSVNVNNNRLPQIIKQLHPAASAAIRKAALAIAMRAKGNAPVETGYLRRSIAASENGDDLHWLVSVGAVYGIYVEMGHHTRGGTGWVPPQPYLTPAAEIGRVELQAAFRSLEALLGAA